MDELLIKREADSERPKILIVDDDDKNHRVYERILAPLDLYIEKTSSGIEALEVAHRHDFFLILMDVQMPIMDGFETASLILGHPKTQHIPVIFVTAFSKDEAFEFKGYESGAVDYLTKPINDNILKSKVSIFLQLWQQRHSLQDNHLELKRLNEALTKSHVVMEKARDKAEAATQVKSTFLSNMSHELRSPLNAILAFSQKLVQNKSNNLNVQEAKSASIINRSGGDLLRLIDDILDLAKVEAGMIELEIGAFSLQEMLHNMVAQQTPLIEEKYSPLELRLNVAKDVPDIIQTDSLRLGQIIRNLLSNAIKFTSEGLISINVKLLTKTRLAISVSDTGIGIKPENLACIFEAFKQEDSSVTRRFGGTGLGLSITLNLVNLLEGDIRIQSELNQGSCFTVEIPFDLAKGKKTLPLSDNALESIDSHISDVEILPKNSKEPQASNVEIPCVTPDATKASLGYCIEHKKQLLNNKTILLVEDNPINVEIVLAALEDYNLNIILAENGEVALDKLANLKLPDIILMDLMMPVMDGYEAIKLIRKNPIWQFLPIIVLTASKMAETKQLCFEIGATDYMNKPLNMDALVNKLIDAISGSHRDSDMVKSNAH